MVKSEHKGRTEPWTENSSSYSPAKPSSGMQLLIMGCLRANLSLPKD